jgi:glutamate-ammonia-ligase adenylyltransferase
LRRLLTLCAASPWIAEQITRFPLLLDELLNEGRLFKPPGAGAGRRAARAPDAHPRRRPRTADGALRHFKLAHRLRVAASEIAGSLPLMKVSDYLTWLAEAILEQVLALAWRQTVAATARRCARQPVRSGLHHCRLWESRRLELGHGSDLDLVFIHDGDPQAETDGPKPIDGAQFFTRLGQRIIHLLTTQTNSGQLYEVDMRLRPSGASGLLVSSLGPSSAIRKMKPGPGSIRPWCGRGCWWAVRMSAGVREGARQVLGKRDLAKLRQEVSEMRAKMRDNLGTKAPRPVPRPMPSRPRRRSTSSRTPEVSSILNLWCNTRPWRGRTTPAIAALDR